MKGFRGTNPAYLSVKTNGGTDLNWPGVALPGSLATESWVEQIVTIPAGATTLQAGVTWNTTVTTGDIFYINEFELIQLTTATTPEYQYHLKDHLGNVRVTFTTKDETESATATLETANMGAEQAKFLRYQNARRVQSSLFDRTNGASPGYSQRLNGSVNEKFGLARSISVMPGDKLNIEVYAKYVDSNSGSWSAALATLMSQIQGGAAGVVVDGTTYAASTTSFPFAGLVNTAGSTGGPKAYLNYILFDRNFKQITSGYKRLSSGPMVTNTTVDVPHERLFFDNLTITEAGYIYIFLSNEETSNVEVFFDDFKVEHIKSPIVSAQDYYPFGLTYNSYTRENSVQNKYLYNGGSELQDDLGLEVYETFYRMLDPALGRWWQVDPMVDNFYDWTPYNYSYNNPATRNDPKGDCPPGTDCGTQRSQDAPTTSAGERFANALVSTWNYFTGDAPTGSKVTTAMEMTLPVDATLVLGKVAFGKSGEITQEQAIGAVKDVALLPLLAAGAEMKVATIETKLPTVETAVAKVEKAVHGNSKLSTKSTTLYRLETKQGDYLKTGVTSKPVPENRYTRAFMKDKQMIYLDQGKRADMLIKERNIVETSPGPLNFEPWAGTKKTP